MMGHVRDLVSEMRRELDFYFQEQATVKTSGRAVRAKFVKTKRILKYLFGLNGFLGFFGVKLVGQSSSLMNTEEYRGYEFFWYVLNHADELDKIYELFVDDKSRETFDWLVKFRMAYAFLYDKALDVFPGPIARGEEERLFKDVWRGRVKGLPRMLTPMEEMHLVYTYILEQYRLPGLCEVESGDIVVDGGALVGDTTLYFSNLVGEHGHVHAFEPAPDNFEFLIKNIALNGCSNVTAYQKALWSESGSLKVGAGGGGSSVKDVGGIAVNSVSVDDFFGDDTGEKKLNFLKLDIVGSEMSALLGAEKTIERCHPKLAISVYHGAKDFHDIPSYINELMPYHFYFRHFSSSVVGTTLFCVPK